MPDPDKTLEAGRSLLEPVLARHGFSWTPGSSGTGSGGRFASGEFVRGERRLELHFRYSLGLVTYHVGTHSVDHASYMRAVLGPAGGNQYPGFSTDPLDAFRHLAHDLESYCGAFLGNSDPEFEAIVRKAAAEARPPGVRRLP